jgi:hypothetical protein
MHIPLQVIDSFFLPVVIRSLTVVKHDGYFGRPCYPCRSSTETIFLLEQLDIMKYFNINVLSTFSYIFILFASQFNYNILTNS